MFLWVRDLAGRISAPVSIRTLYDPGEPPVVTNLFATTSDAACSPIAPSDVVVRENEALFIKWNVDFPPSYPFGPTGAPESTVPTGAAIELDYTTNERDYVDIPNAQALLNGSNGGCSLTPLSTNAACPSGPNEATAKTGCFTWPAGSPKPNGYFRIRLRATNNKGIQSVRSTVPPLNTYDPGPTAATGDDALSRRLDFRAGNPDPGLGGNARATVLNNRVTRADAAFDMGSFAVSSRGVIYFRDRDNGLLWINPVNGNVERLIRLDDSQTGQGDGQDLFAGDGTPNTAITLQQPHFITVDFDDNLLVVDYNRVRRIEADPATGLPLRIDLLMGGGSTTSGQDVSPTAVQLSNQCEGCFISVLPNGDILVPSWLYLREATGGTLWHYKANRPSGAPTVSNINYSGHGAWIPLYNLPEPADCTVPGTPCVDTNRGLCDARPDSGTYRQCLGCADDGSSTSSLPWPSCPAGTRCNTNPASDNYNVCEWEISNCTMQEPIVELDNTGNISRMHAWLTGTYIGSPCIRNQVRPSSSVMANASCERVSAPYLRTPGGIARMFSCGTPRAFSGQPQKLENIVWASWSSLEATTNSMTLASGSKGRTTVPRILESSSMVRAAASSGSPITSAARSLRCTCRCSTRRTAPASAELEMTASMIWLPPARIKSGNSA